MPASSSDPLALLQALTTHKQTDVANFARCVSGYVESGDPAWAARVTAPAFDRKIVELGVAVAVAPLGVTERRIVEFVALLYRASPSFVWPNKHELLKGIASAALRGEDGRRLVDGEHVFELLVSLGFTAADMEQLIETVLHSGAFRAWEPDRSGMEPTPWERRVLALDADALILALKGTQSEGFVHALISERSEVLHAWIAEVRRMQSHASVAPGQVEAVITRWEDQDGFALEYVEKAATAWDRALVLDKLMELRPERHRETFLSLAGKPDLMARGALFERLCEWAPERALAVLPVILKGGYSKDHYAQVAEYRKAIELAVEHWEPAGRAIFEAVATLPEVSERATALECLLLKRTAGFAVEASTIARAMLAAGEGLDAKERILRAMSHGASDLFMDEWRELLGSSSKRLRELAIGALGQTDKRTGAFIARGFLDSKKSDQRLGAAVYLAEMGNESDVPFLKKAFAKEKSAAVWEELKKALAGHGVAVPAGRTRSQVEAEEAAPASLAEWENVLAARKRSPKPPTAEWLDPAALPALPATDGTVIGPMVLAHLFSTQAARKEVAESVKVDYTFKELPDGNSELHTTKTPIPGQRSIQIDPALAPILAWIDRARSGDFALALLEAWLGSEQEAKHRWAMTFAGALGDTRILSVLNSWIPKWCEAGRGKLAEYAAQAIALQGSDEALMLLDALATRYRSKQRNIGAAAAQAFQAAAEARGLSPDELGDVVVPAFGFDAEGIRDFSWQGGAARAELGVELKLSWSDAESDKALKGLPAGAPDALKTEVKELGKLLREAAKSQAARLELALVRQRRWPVARWRELYENHPVLRAYATRLVWGVYRRSATGSEELSRCFRRYPNGLLADAAGGLEELPETDSLIGIVHPLELSAEATAAWRAHLERFKVTAPFPQLDRAVERLDPLHANRRELVVAKGVEIGSGTFRSRAERRGWVRGSMADAGIVSNYVKTFAGAGVEVELDLDGLFVGSDPTDTLTLGVARFVSAIAAVRDSYEYNVATEAAGNRVWAFGKVPPVVYSETVGDLKAIAGIVADAAAAENGDV